MSAIIPAILIALVAGILRQSFFLALPAPLASIDPILIALTAYVVALDGRKALCVALLGGAVADALSPLPFGAHTGAYVLAALVAYALFTNVLTTHDWPSMLMVALAALGTTSAMLAIARMLSATFSSGAARQIAEGSTWSAILLGIAAHLAATIAAFAILSRIRDRRGGYVH